MMAPPDVKKQRLLTEKLDVTKNRFTASKIPSDLDVIIVGSGMSVAYLQMLLAFVSLTFRHYLFYLEA